MPMLDAALAFAITMLGVASIVTAIVGKIGASKSYRSEKLKEQLRDFYHAYVAPTLAEKAEAVAGQVDRKVDAKAQEFLDSVLKGNKVEVEMSTMELVTRLRGTPMVQGLEAKATGEIDQAMTRLADGWEQLGEKFSAGFRARARLASYAVGVLLAAVLNIDSIHIVETYLNDDDVRAEALGKQDAMLAQYAAFLGAQTPEAATEGVERTVSEIRADIDALRADGLPLGWDHKPWAECSDALAVRLPRCNVATAGVTPSALGSWAAWALGILITGYLAGLGAPFWYDFITGINHIAQTRRGSQKRNTREQPQTA